ncbi:MAG: hypothetical protein AAF322_20430, partial [Pseudomonadota bacterium]
AASAGGMESLEYAPTGGYQWINPVWVNLLGDPTLTAFPLAPPGDLSVAREGGGATLTWSPPSDASEVGYRVLRAPDCGGPFAALNPDVLLEATRFDDRTAPEEACYMVRAHGLRTVYAGSFFAFSGGTAAALPR